MNLSERAMLVSLHISAWGGERIDHDVTDDTNTAHGASADAGRYVKHLVGKHHFKALNYAKGVLKNRHLMLTLPWGDNGQRIISAEAFDSYTAEMRKLKDAFEQEVAAFVKSYPAIKEARRVDLNGMYREEDFPSIEGVKSRFACAIEFRPVPEAGDFRVALAADDVAQIRKEIDEANTAAVSDAMAEAWRRLHKVVQNMAERLSGYTVDADGNRQGRIHDSIVGNVRDMCNVLKGLNVAGDPVLDQMVKDVSDKLGKYDASVLKDTDGIREKVADEARKLADKMAGLY